MGGLVFANDINAAGKPVRTPRMPPELYKRLSAEFHEKLQTLFDRVVVPRDAPAKADYGDIDYLVEGIKLDTLARVDIWRKVKLLFGAELEVSRGGSHSYAVPHPEILGAYVQIDVELSPGNGIPDGRELFEWTKFIKSDSDLLQIIGVSHRPLGLVCNDQGLHVRVEEIEPYNKKKALLFLTRDPNRAIEFYGLDSARYWAGFTDETDLFDWATSGRFFCSTVFEQRIEKSNDRSRQAKRPMYARFVENYMPAHAHQNDSNIWTRQEVLDEALKMFDRQLEYNAMLQEHRFKEAEEDLWKEMRTIVPAEGKSLSSALKGLRRWVIFQNGKPHIASDPILDDKPEWTKAMAPGSQESLFSWVKMHWEETKALERARATAAKAGAMTA
ncbi:hypothetical protein GQ44DRAFT_697970 [Phaeosphaeriaceae sp. PMI808]|nr:hypothetical protein GQ44DRAFT_697970 [Phaeosphaeriaceae sp. PMI808]